MRPYNLLVTGVGGQGTVVASDILAAVGLAAGYNVKKSDVLGLAIRGGSVISHVRWGDIVHSPIIPEGRVDVLLAFEFLEALRWLDQLDPDGAILVNRQRIFPVSVSSGSAEYPSMDETNSALRAAAAEVFAVPGLDIAQELGNTRTLNVVLLGALSGYLEFDREIWVEVIRCRVPAKAADLNASAFWRGREALEGCRLAGGALAKATVGDAMRILVVNPNTSEAMTEHLRRELTALKGPDTELEFANPEHGPVSIESAYDEALAIPPTLDLVRRAERDGFDAVVIALLLGPGPRGRARAGVDPGRGNRGVDTPPCGPAGSPVHHPDLLPGACAQQDRARHGQRSRQPARVRTAART